jgi:alpha-mannosidase
VQFVVSSVKLAEDGAGWLVRGYNASSQPVTVSFKTIQLVHSVQRVNLAEEPIEGLALVNPDELRLAVNPHEVLTLRFAVK